MVTVFLPNEQAPLDAPCMVQVPPAEATVFLADMPQPSWAEAALADAPQPSWAVEASEALALLPWAYGHSPDAEAVEALLSLFGQAIAVAAEAPTTSRAKAKEESRVARTLHLHGRPNGKRARTGATTQEVRASGAARSTAQPRAGAV